MSFIFLSKEAISVRVCIFNVAHFERFSYSRPANSLLLQSNFCKCINILSSLYITISASEIFYPVKYGSLFLISIASNVLIHSFTSSTHNFCCYLSGLVEKTSGSHFTLNNYWHGIDNLAWCHPMRPLMLFS